MHVFICLHACIHVCVSVRAYVSISSVSVCMHTYIHTRTQCRERHGKLLIQIHNTYIYLHTYTHTETHEIYGRLRVHIHHTYIHIHTHVNTHTRTEKHTRPTAGCLSICEKAIDGSSHNTYIHTYIHAYIYRETHETYGRLLVDLR